MSFSLSRLTIYPIKSIQGLSQESCAITDTGLLGDRQYMLTDDNGEFISGRTSPSLTLIKTHILDDNTWLLSHPDMAEDLRFNQDLITSVYKEVLIWDDSLQAQVADASVNQWFSQLLGKDVEMVFFGEKSERVTGRRPDKSIAFSDGYPVLLTTEASLAELNDCCPEDIEMERFRPNFVISGNDAFAEDKWKRIKIGEVEFENVKPCDRCIFITLNPKTAEKTKRGEPLKSLGKFRTKKGEGIHFGINLIALNSGVVKVNDTVEILEYQECEPYRDRR